MKRVVVQYKLRVERVVEHEALLAAVFEELSAASPDGFGYEVLKLADGVSFVHSATLSGENPLPALQAFKRFVARIDERCESPPKTSAATLAGSFPPP